MSENGNFRWRNELVRIGANMRVLLTSALFIPTAAIDAGAIEVLPKCMNDLLKCGGEFRTYKYKIGCTLSGWRSER